MHLIVPGFPLQVEKFFIQFISKTSKRLRLAEYLTLGFTFQVFTNLRDFFTLVPDPQIFMLSKVCVQEKTQFLYYESYELLNH